MLNFQSLLDLCLTQILGTLGKILEHFTIIEGKSYISNPILGHLRFGCIFTGKLSLCLLYEILCEALDWHNVSLLLICLVFLAVIINLGLIYYILVELSADVATD